MSGANPGRPVSFAAAADFRVWLTEHHATASELQVRLFNRQSSRGGLTYAQALDEALCFGWIDGVRKGFDAESYTIRFTPRKERSIWSAVNVRHAERLIREGRMQPAGAKAFAARTAARTGVYSFENKPKALPPPFEEQFKRDGVAWAFFQEQPPGYRRTVLWWVLSAKQEATQLRRLGRLIAESAAGRRIDFMAPSSSRRAVP